MTNALINFKKIRSLSSVWLVSLESSIENVPKKRFLQLRHWRFSKKAKSLVVVAIVAVLLISVFAFLSKPSGGKGDVIPQNNDNGTATASPLPSTNKTNGNPLSGIANWFSQIGSNMQTKLILHPSNPAY